MRFQEKEMRMSTVHYRPAATRIKGPENRIARHGARLIDGLQQHDTTQSNDARRVTNQLVISLDHRPERDDDRVTNANCRRGVCACIESYKMRAERLGRVLPSEIT